MNRQLLLIFLLVVNILSVFAKNGYSENCPIEECIGQITSISTPSDSDTVIITRNGQTHVAVLGDCLLYGDKVEVFNSAIALLQTEEYSLELSKTKPHQKWRAPSKTKNIPDPDNFLQKAEKVWEALTTNYNLPTKVLARGQEIDCMDYSGYTDNTIPIAALPSLKTRKQIIGTDLKQIAVAWKKGTGFDRVQLRLFNSSGDVIFSKNICHVNWYVIDISSIAPIPMPGLYLKVTDIKGHSIEWNIEILPSEQMPHPSKPFFEKSMLGVWRFLSSSSEYRLDAFSRLIGSDTFLVAPSWVLSASLSGFDPEKVQN